MLSKRCEPCDVRVTVVFRAAPRAVAVFMANVSWVWSPALSKLTGHSWKTSDSRSDTLFPLSLLQPDSQGPSRVPSCIPRNPGLRLRPPASPGAFPCRVITIST